MPERAPSPEAGRKSVLSKEFGDIVDPQAYLDTAREGAEKFRALIAGVKK